MPNWCNNLFTVEGAKDQIDIFEKFLEINNGKNWFNFFSPIPLSEQEGERWYGWAVENWGCKWNCDAQDWTRDENKISFWFDSPWAPPIQLYYKIRDLGYTVNAEYCEHGVGFVGEFVDGVHEHYEYEDEDDLDFIPEHLIENWNLRDDFEKWEDDDDDYQW